MSPAQVVLLGKAYWKSVINWKELGAYGVINPSDVDELLFTDDVQARRHSRIPQAVRHASSHTRLPCMAGGFRLHRSLARGGPDAVERRDGRLDGRLVMKE